MPLTLLDTTLLSNFAHAQRPGLLQLFFGADAAVTPTIVEEMQKGVDLGLVPPCSWDWLKVLKPTEEELHDANMLLSQLDPGEAECIAVASHRGGRFCSDDRVARRLAQNRGIPVAGTLGVLLTLTQQKKLTIDEANQCLNAMIAGGYRSPVASLLELLEG